MFTKRQANFFTYIGVLGVCGNCWARMSILELLDSPNVLIISADTGEKAIRLLKKESFDCMVLARQAELGVPCRVQVPVG